MKTSLAGGGETDTGVPAVPAHESGETFIEVVGRSAHPSFFLLTVA